MKTFKILFAAIIFVGFTGAAFAQTTEDTQAVTASAVVISDISIEDVRNVDFGVVDVGTIAELDETVDPTLEAAATNAGRGDAGFQFGRIEVSSAQDIAFRLDYDNNVTLSNQNGNGEMTFEPSIAHTTDDEATFGQTIDLTEITSSGNDFFFIGGTMDVGAEQETGNYEGTFNVTVEYL